MKHAGCPSCGGGLVEILQRGLHADKSKGTPNGCPLLYEKYFSVIDFLILVARLAGQLEPQLIHDADIHLGEHDGSVHLAAAKFFQLLEGVRRIRVARRVHGERDQNLVGVKARVL